MSFCFFSFSSSLLSLSLSLSLYLSLSPSLAISHGPLYPFLFLSPSFSSYLAFPLPLFK